MALVTNSIPETLRELLAKLEFLSMIGLNKKPCMNDMTFVDADSWIGAFKRALAGEGRKSLILHLNSIIDTAVRALEEFKNTDFLQLIVNKLANAKSGINNLITTYANYPDTISKLKICLDNIDFQLRNHRNLLSVAQAPAQEARRTRRESASEDPPDDPPLPSGEGLFD